MRNLIFAVCLFMGAMACQNRSNSGNNTPANPEQTMETVATTELPADFEAFYKKFHEDSLYQMSHIVWPLQGETSEQIDSTHHRKKLVSWEPGDWRMHHPVDFSTGEFKHEYEMVGKVLVMEHIHYAAANYGLERRFALNENNEWELIFYSDMQETK